MKLRSTVLRAATAAAFALLLASCGGESLVAFVPDRVLVFGDQASVITLEPVASQGKKYTVNAINADGTFNCAGNPIWVQILAASYGIGFPECPGAVAATAQAGRILAKVGATAGGTGEDDLAQQVTRQLALPVAQGGGIGSNDLVSVLVGVNDVVAAFERYKAGASPADAESQVEAAGVAIGTQVNRIVDAGGKVILSSVPAVSLTPYGRSQDAADLLVLTTLTERLNAKLQVTFINDGRHIGYIQINPYLFNVVVSPGSYGYVNAQDAVCIPLNVLTCTTNTLATDSGGNAGGALTWLWASALQLSPGGHAQLGSLASSRAHNQPF